MKLFVQVVLLALWAVAASAPVAAHHSGQFFTREAVTLTGTVKQMQLTNPHSWLELMVPGEDGKLVQWSIEMSAPVVMFRAGWTKNTAKPGDKVTVVARPMIDGRPGGAYVNITLADGSMLGRASPTD